MRRILFVDDEQNLLSGLRRLLRRKRGVWDMSFFLGAERALAEMESAPPDVVVSDMKMPGMDGAQLLAEVRRRYPRTSRMILSGHADRMSKISVVGPTQHFLAKPCDMDSLVRAIERILVLNDLVTDNTLADRLGGSSEVPGAPELFEEMLTVASSPLSSVTDILSAIEKDSEASTEVLRLANSLLFGLPTSVNTIAQAAGLLGLETVQGIALASAVYHASENDPAGLDGQALHRRGLSVARAAVCMARAETWSESAVTDAFFAGLLFDVGLLWSARSDPQGWSRLLQARPVGLRDLALAEETAFGVTMARMSAFLLARWGFPETIISAISDMPVTLGAGPAEDVATLLAVARHRILRPSIPLADAGLVGVPDDQLQRWDCACSDVVATVVEEAILPRKSSPVLHT